MTPSPPSIPKGSHHFHTFQFFNSIAFSLVLGTPILLFAKHIGVTETMLGVLAAITPLSTFWNIPSVALLPKFGYRRYLLFNFFFRAFFFWTTALVAFYSLSLSVITLLTFLIVSLLFANFFRGLGCVVFLPWISDLVPPARRGLFLSHNNMAMLLGQIVGMVIPGILLTRESTSARFAFIFLLGGAFGFTCLFFAARIPGGEKTHHLSQHGDKISLQTIFSHPAFLKLLMFNLLYFFTFGALVPFTISFMRDFLAIKDDMILYITAMSALGGMVGLYVNSKFIDALHNKTVIFLTVLTFLCILFVLFLIAAKVLVPWKSVFFLLLAGQGAAFWVFTAANHRAIMGSMPTKGRNHYFAYLLVIGQIVCAISPIFCGFFLDQLTTFQTSFLRISLNHYSLFYLFLLILCTLNLFLTPFLPEVSSQPNLLETTNLRISTLLKRPFRFWIK